MVKSDRPTIFIGSSAEAKLLTEQLTQLLEAHDVVNVLPWYEAFNVGYAAIEDLARRLDDVDFAAFFFRPDDQVTRRGRTEDVTRDNVVFELGLFMGKLNRNRTFALVQKGVELPTDFRGVTYLPYQEESLHDIANKISNKVQELGFLARVPKHAHVVQPGGGGRNAYDTIASALAAAEPGDVILVSPGTYSEPIVVDKPIELIGIGVGEHQRAVLRASNSSTLVYTAPGGSGRVTNLVIEAGGSGDCATVDIANGYLVVAGCQITNHGVAEACVRVRGDGRARIVANSISDGHGAGVVVCERGYADLVDNLVSRHAHSCVDIRDGTQPRLFGNRIGNGRSGGVLIHGASVPVLERNDIYENRDAAIAIAGSADPQVTGNRIHDGFGAGVWVGEAGRGTISENDIYNNRGTGVEIAARGEPLIVNNRIYNGAAGGVLLKEGARGRIDHNEISGNQRAGVAFLQGAVPQTFNRNRIVDGRAEGVYDEIAIKPGDNDIARNAGGDWCTAS